MEATIDKFGRLVIHAENYIEYYAVTNIKNQKYIVKEPEENN